MQSSPGWQIRPIQRDNPVPLSQRRGRPARRRNLSPRPSFKAASQRPQPADWCCSQHRKGPAMIRLRRSLIEGLEEPSPAPQAVRDALQNAVKLEHATIPLYLYGLYSLAHGKNGEIAEILESVVVEEMLHMTLASNVLNALGGSPQIDQPGFIPTYPGPLPGGVEGGLTVALAPFSMTQLETYLT